MRWFWIDRFIEFESGRRATAVKNVSLAEDHLHDHFSGHPLMPASLIIEGLAQTGGLLVAQYSDFASRIVLAKIGRAKFHFHPRPGDTLLYEAIVQDISREGGVVFCTSRLGERPQAEVELFFVSVGEDFAGKSLFEPADFLAMLKLLGIFEVGRTADGQPLSVPDDLAQAEAQFNDGISVQS